MDSPLCLKFRVQFDDVVLVLRALQPEEMERGMTLLDESKKVVTPKEIAAKMTEAQEFVRSLMVDVEKEEPGDPPTRTPVQNWQEQIGGSGLISGWNAIRIINAVCFCSPGKMALVGLD